MKSAKGSTSNTQTKAIGGGEGARMEAEGQEQPPKEELEKLDNAADDETYHASKKEHHIRYTGHHIGPCSCRQWKKWA